MARYIPLNEVIGSIEVNGVDRPRPSSVFYPRRNDQVQAFKWDGKSDTITRIAALTKLVKTVKVAYDWSGPTDLWVNTWRVQRGEWLVFDPSMDSDGDVLTDDEFHQKYSHDGR